MNAFGWFLRECTRRVAGPLAECTHAGCRCAQLILLVAAGLSASAQRLTVAADKMNVCYLGVDNPLSAAAFGCEEKELVLKTTNGSIVRDTGSGFVYRPARRPVLF